MSRLARAALWAATLATSAACGADAPRAEFRAMTDNYRLRVSADPSPPRAREPTRYRIVVSDRESGEPVEGGEGRIFATSRDGANIWNVLDQGPEIGTYYSSLRYVTAGDWAVAIQFRRDSSRPLERVDWMQDVLPERGGSPEF